MAVLRRVLPPSRPRPFWRRSAEECAVACSFFTRPPKGRCKAERAGAVFAACGLPFARLAREGAAVEASRRFTRFYRSAVYAAGANAHFDPDNSAVQRSPALLSVNVVFTCATTGGTIRHGSCPACDEKAAPRGAPPIRQGSVPPPPFAFEPCLRRLARSLSASASAPRGKLGKKQIPLQKAQPKFRLSLKTRPRRVKAGFQLIHNCVAPSGPSLPRLVETGGTC